MKKSELIDILNKCWDAVEESKLGNMFTVNTNGEKIYLPLQCQAFMNILGSELPHININTTSLSQPNDLNININEPGEEWKRKSS